MFGIVTTFDRVIDRAGFASDADAGTALKVLLEEAATTSIFISSGTYLIPTGFQVPAGGHKVIVGETNTIIKMTTALAQADFSLVVNIVCHNIIFDGGTTGGDTVLNGGLVSLDDQIGKFFYNCTAKDSAESFFAGTNDPLAPIAPGAENGAMFGCHATGFDATATAAAGFHALAHLHSCSVDAAGIAGADGFNKCWRLSGCTASKCVIGFDGIKHGSACYAFECNTGFDGGGGNLTGCEARSASGGGLVGFNNLVNVSGCLAQGVGGGFSAGGFVGCENVSGCRAAATGDEGFDNCDNVSGCRATSNSTDGFKNCNFLSACQSDSNTGDGFANCRAISGFSSTTNSVDGFDATCLEIAAGAATGNGTNYNAGVLKRDLDSTT